MKTIYYDGVAALTEDEIADAVMDLATTLAQYGQYEATVLPVLVDDRVESLTLMLGPTIHVSTLTSPPRPGVAIPSADRAVLAIRARVHALVHPATSTSPFDEDASALVFQPE